MRGFLALVVALAGPGISISVAQTSMLPMPGLPATSPLQANPTGAGAPQNTSLQSALANSTPCSGANPGTAALPTFDGGGLNFGSTGSGATASAFAQSTRNEGLKPEEAITQTCLLRFRPILMTTLATLLAAVPLALGTGAGTELRQPLGYTIIGGLAVSQVLTLFTTPIVYLYLDRLSAMLKRMRRDRAKADLAGAQATSLHP